jgi:hypothetical protein
MSQIETPTRPIPFKHQTVQQRYEYLVQRFKEKMDEWRIWEDDCNAAGRNAQNAGNYPLSCGMFGKAKTIRQMRQEIEPYVDRHVKALNEVQQVAIPQAESVHP